MAETLDFFQIKFWHQVYCRSVDLLEDYLKRGFEEGIDDDLFVDLGLIHTHQLIADLRAELERMLLLSLFSAIEAELKFLVDTRLEGIQDRLAFPSLTFDRLLLEELNRPEINGDRAKLLKHLSTEKVLTWLDLQQQALQTSQKSTSDLKSLWKMRHWLAHGRYFPIPSPYNEKGIPAFSYNYFESKLTRFATDFGLTRSGVYQPVHIP